MSRCLGNGEGKNMYKLCMIWAEDGMRLLVSIFIQTLIGTRCCPATREQGILMVRRRNSECDMFLSKLTEETLMEGGGEASQSQYVRRI